MTSLLAPLCLSLGLLNAAPSTQDQKPATAGPTERGFLLPNGWTLTPAGKHVVLTDLPLNIVPLADNRRALVATSGYNKHELVADRPRTAKSDRQGGGPGKLVWIGREPRSGAHLVVGRRPGPLCMNSRSNKAPSLRKTRGFRSRRIPPQASRNGDRASHTFRSGLFLDAETQTLYSLDIDAGTISAIDLKSGKVAKSAVCGGRPVRRGPLAEPGHALRFRLGGAGRAGRAAGRFARRVPHRRRRASEPARAASQRTIACSSPAPRPTTFR